LKFVFLGDVGSTNDEAVSYLEAGDKPPFWIAAKSQSAGRGRRGRSWQSDNGNLYCTGVYPVLNTPQLTGLLSFTAALALYDALETYIDPNDISIKWPNDVLVKGAKVAGILLEMRNNHVLVGIGVNLVSSPEGTPYPATSLLANMTEAQLSQTEPAIPTPESVLAVLAARFQHWHDTLIERGFVHLRQVWLLRAKNVPGNVTVNLSNESFKGRAIDMGPNGELQVRLMNGTIRNIHAGDVFFEPRDDE